MPGFAGQTLGTSGTLGTSNGETRRVAGPRIRVSVSGGAGLYAGLQAHKLKGLTNRLRTFRGP